ncbi:MAG TPA: hypothetical protein VGM76_09455 [Lacipirellulaceae bacterium]|jgi:hypothetical protein
MATDQPISSSFTDAELLYRYLGERIGGGEREAPVDRLLAEFAEYRRELEEVRAKLREAEASSARGESGPLDLEDVIRRGRERLAWEGITD